MNEKFFDLKKEKQDRMINASMKIFASAGYTHASTDDIVKEAGVSKGLLFHYFTSKIGLYTFLYDYATKYEQLELSTCVGKNETDYFALRTQILKAQANCMRSYPYLSMFIDRADREENSEASRAVGEKVLAHAEQLKEILMRADLSRFKPEADVGMTGKMLTGAFHSILADVLVLEAEKAPEAYTKTCGEYINMMRTLCYREDADFEQAAAAAVQEPVNEEESL